MTRKLTQETRTKISKSHTGKKQSPETKAKIRESLKKYHGLPESKIKLEKKDVEIKNNIIYIQSSGAVKNKIFIFKNQIISSINSQTPLKVIDVK